MRAKTQSRSFGSFVNSYIFVYFQLFEVENNNVRENIKNIFAIYGDNVLRCNVLLSVFFRPFVVIMQE